MTYRIASVGAHEISIPEDDPRWRSSSRWRTVLSVRRACRLGRQVGGVEDLHALDSEMAAFRARPLDHVGPS